LRLARAIGILIKQPFEDTAMEFMIMPLKRFADFSGRSRRKEYWMFQLLLAVIYFGVFMASAASKSESVALALIVVFVLVAFIPGIAVQVRRLHDIGKSGWWCFITLVPFVGGIWLFVLNCSEGQNGQNQYGPDPKGRLSEHDANVFA
jgi:uncharacterized membrane protein YhaH (DUF805 family)